MQVNGYAKTDFKDTEIGAIPADWELLPLRRLGKEFFGGGTPSTKRADFWGGDIAWVTSAYIDDNLYLDKCAGFITQAGLENSSTRLVPKGNLLIGTRVGVGKATINLLDTAISQDLTAMIVDRSRINVEFLAYVIKSEAIQHLMLAGARGTTIKGIPRADLVDDQSG